MKSIVLLLSLIVPLPLMGLAPMAYSDSLKTNYNSNSQTIVVEGPEIDIARNDVVLKLDPQYPVDDPNTMSSDFGYRLLSNCNNCSNNHQGVDFPQSEKNDEIYSILDGVVTRVEHKGGFGLHVYIDHQVYWDDALVYTSIYAHMRPNNVTKSLSVGDKVSKGQLIGYIGNTGISTGPHLHFEIHKNGKVLDPEQFYAINLK